MLAMFYTHKNNNNNNNKQDALKFARRSRRTGLVASDIDYSLKVRLIEVRNKHTNKEEQENDACLFMVCCCMLCC